MKINLKKKIASLVLVSIMGLSVVGCSSKKEESKEDTTKTEQETQVATTKDDYTYDNNDYLVSLNWLEQSMEDNKDLVIIDARTDKEYKAGHIPGAINVIWQSLSKVDGKPGEKDWGTLFDAQNLTKALRAIGVKEDSQIVVYANKSAWGEDGRVVWSLKRAGLDARMLNGGFDLWSSENKEITKDVPKVEASDITISEVKSDLNITTDDLKKEYDNLKIIDVREKDEYEGATKYGEARGGHLPKAINITFNKLYNEDGTVKSNEEIAKIMDEAGIKKDDNIVTYCTGGIRSAHMALLLKNAGYENVRNYDASFYEWAGDPSNELEK
ncbi:MAG: sulfurtransferase [Clostridioides sp.]|jgi:thiosulfate/3-mercaptopyruvate sulfurtransferase|nr:sulfurtransferase [Clostridioides sp.]